MWRRRRTGTVDDEELERLMADRHRVLIAKQVRSWAETARVTGKGLARARRTRDLEEIRSWERTDDLARSTLKGHLARYPELADPELVKRLAPTRVERMVRRALGRSH